MRPCSGRWGGRVCRCLGGRCCPSCVPPCVLGSLGCSTAPVGEVGLLPLLDWVRGSTVGMMLADATIQQWPVFVDLRVEASDEHPRDSRCWCRGRAQYLWSGYSNFLGMIFPLHHYFSITLSQIHEHRQSTQLKIHNFLTSIVTNLSVVRMCLNLIAQVEK